MLLLGLVLWFACLVCGPAHTHPPSLTGCYTLGMYSTKKNAINISLSGEVAAIKQRLVDKLVRPQIALHPPNIQTIQSW